MTKYLTVVIDFPWNLKGNRAEGRTLKLDRKPIYRKPLPSANYALMSNEEILSFPIDEYANEDCLLFLWTVNGRTVQGPPAIDIGLRFLEKNGFALKSIITWCKPQGIGLFSPIITMTEHCIFAFRGAWKMLVGSHYGVMKNYFKTDRQIRHSEKPAKFYQLLRDWTPEPRIDIFARRAHTGFEGWGNEYVANSEEGTLLEFIDLETEEINEIQRELGELDDDITGGIE